MKKYTWIVAAALMLALPAFAQADGHHGHGGWGHGGWGHHDGGSHWSINLGFGFGGPVYDGGGYGGYYAPAYVAPAPVYVAPPPVVYYAPPPPVYYYPAPSCGPSSYYYGGGFSYHHH